MRKTLALVTVSLLFNLLAFADETVKPPKTFLEHAKDGAALPKAGAGGAAPKPYDPAKDKKVCEPIVDLADIRMQSALVNLYAATGGELKEEALLLRVPAGKAITDSIYEAAKKLLTKTLKREPTEAEILVEQENLTPGLVKEYATLSRTESAKIVAKLPITQLEKMLLAAAKVDKEKGTNVNLNWLLETLRNPSLFTLESLERLAKEAKDADYDKENAKEPFKKLLYETLLSQKRALNLNAAAKAAYMMSLGQEVLKQK